MPSMIRVHVRLPRVGSGIVYYKNMVQALSAIPKVLRRPQNSRKKIPSFSSSRRKKMSDPAPAPTASPAAKPVAKPAAKPKAKPAKARKPVVKSDHPSYKEMVTASIAKLAERNGSSRQAIVKAVKNDYKVNEKADQFIKLALKRMTENKELIQVKGVGASGSFKVNKEKKAATKKAKAGTKSKAAAKPKPAAKKATTPKKTTKKPAAKKAAAKPKKAVAKKASTPKKAAAKKPAAKKAAAKKPSTKPAAKKAAAKPKAKKPAAKPAAKPKKAAAKKPAAKKAAAAAKK